MKAEKIHKISKEEANRRLLSTIKDGEVVRLDAGLYQGLQTTACRLSKRYSTATLGKWLVIHKKKINNEQQDCNN